MDNEQIDIDVALESGIRMIGASRIGVSRYGWGFKSAGCRIEHQQFGEAWLKVRKSPADKLNRRLWDGELMTIPFENVPKPSIYGHFDWNRGTSRYRAIITEAAEPAISTTPNPSVELRLTDSWWAELSAAISVIRIQSTDRPSIRDDLIRRRLKERYDLSFAGPAPMRETAHSDLHWANLTENPLRILDWESWGRGPFGLDVAYLHVFSIAQKPLISRLKEAFSETIARPEYDLTFLFCAAEIQRMSELYGVYTEILPALNAETTVIRASGRIFDLPCVNVC